MLLPKFEIIYLDVGDKLHFLTGVYFSAIVAKYLFKVSATISESEVKLLSNAVWADCLFYDALADLTTTVK